MQDHTFSMFEGLSILCQEGYRITSLLLEGAFASPLVPPRTFHGHGQLVIQ